MMSVAVYDNYEGIWLLEGSMIIAKFKDEVDLHEHFMDLVAVCMAMAAKDLLLGTSPDVSIALAKEADQWANLLTEHGGLPC